jgi:hypothetical protein
MSFGGVYAHLQGVWFSISVFMVSDGEEKRWAKNNIIIRIQG